MSRSGARREGLRAGLVVAAALALHLASAAASAQPPPPPAPAPAVQLTPPVQQALLRLQEEWLQWIGAFYQGREERAERVVARLLETAAPGRHDAASPTSRWPPSCRPSSGRRRGTSRAPGSGSPPPSGSTRGAPRPPSPRRASPPRRGASTPPRRGPRRPTRASPASRRCARSGCTTPWSGCGRRSSPPASSASRC